MTRGVTIKKDRGKLLTTLLILASLILPWNFLYLIDKELVSKTYGSVPNWFNIYYAFIIFGGGLSLVGTWMWKKWSVYLAVFIAAIAHLVLLLFLKPSNYGLVNYLGNVPIFALWGWAIYRKWKFFE